MVRVLRNGTCMPGETPDFLWCTPAPPHPALSPLVPSPPLTRGGTNRAPHQGSPACADGRGPRVCDGAVLRGVRVHGALRQEDPLVCAEQTRASGGEWKRKKENGLLLSNGASGQVFIFYHLSITAVLT